MAISRRTTVALRTLSTISLIAFGFARATLLPVVQPVAVEHDGVLYLQSNYENEIAGSAGYEGAGFGVAPGVLSEEYHDPHGFDYRREYSPKISQVYSRYLNRPTGDHSEMCGGHDDGWLGGGHDAGVDPDDFESAFVKAGRRIEEYERANQEYLATDPRGLNFSAYVYVATLHAKYNELVTKQIKLKKCLSRKQVALHLPTNPIPPNPWKKKKYCELQSRTTLLTSCDLHDPFRRLDGKCNNPIHTNLGSSFHCHRRLLPPDYSDGIHEIRNGVDGRPLPSPRLVTQLMMPDLDLNDPSLSALHFAWGQFLVHDTFRTIQHLGLAIDCCRMINPPRPNPTQPPVPPFMEVNRGNMKNQPPVPHPECLPITNFPPNKATEMFQQICINTVRSINCNTCNLGPRNQMNVATQVLDLSNFYGGNLLNNSEQLRTFVGGQMLMQLGMNGQTLMPVANQPSDTDTLDLTPCNPPLKNPMGVGCFRTGDGIRGNQNPFIASLTTMMARRHNQHAAALAGVNPHWDDERIFQETRRLMIAEVTKIHYSEYVNLILGERLMKYFHLNVRPHGFTKYNPHVEPSTIQAVGVAAMRIGHSQTRSTYRMIGEHFGRTTSYMLKDRFFNMIDVWQGRITPIIRGILADPSKNVDPYGVIDLKDFLFFNPRRPAVIDLLSININRGRDHGVPAYIHHLHYCTGVEIKSWKDLERFMPSSKVKNLRKVYRNFRDVDLFLGGLLEYHLKGARVGPTFACLIGIQFYHWKYGDRFYFEHGGEAGSFTAEQLNEIRTKVSLSNFLCKTTDMEMVQMRPLEEAGPHNPKISCAGLPELDYFLFRDEGYKKK